MDSEQKHELTEILLGGAGLLLLSLLPLSRWPALLLWAALCLFAGHEVLQEAWEGLRERELLDEDFLMAAASIGAFALGEYREAAAVLLLFRLGELFEDYATEKSRRRIRDLLDLRPDFARVVKEDGSTEEAAPETVTAGSVLLIKPGERIPLDGTVLEGRSSLNTAALTGESLPRDIAEGDSVLSGSINLTGVLRLRAEKPYGESAAARILALLEESAEGKSRSERFITRFSRIYTPAVCAAALALFLLPNLLCLLTGRAAAWLSWLYRALSFLVISCPCALVISVPLTYMAGLGAAGRAGLLIKGSPYLEVLASLDTVVWDKTGTMTEGVFEVDEIHDAQIPEDELLACAALAESGSTHPISRSLQAACKTVPEPSRLGEITEYSGEGVVAQVDGCAVAVGNSRLMERVGAVPEDCHSAGTVVHVARDGRYLGHIVIADRIRAGSAAAVEELRALGVRRQIMLTGDRDATGRRVGHTLGMDSTFCELLPEDKVARVRELLTNMTAGGTLAFVGDGINDAPVLALADAGVAMGAMGSDAAVEAADVVLMHDDPRTLSRGVKIGRKTRRIARENIGLAIGIKLLCLLLCALGLAGMPLAVFADVGVMILCVANALRALHT